MASDIKNNFYFLSLNIYLRIGKGFAKPYKQIRSPLLNKSNLV